MAESNATQVILTDDGLKIIKAQNTADNAAGGVTNLNDPNLMSVIEKQTKASQYAGLTSQYNVILKRAKDANISTAALTTAYNKLNTFITPLLKDTTKASNIDRYTYNSLTYAYNVALSDVQNALKDAYNADIDNMQSSVAVASQAASSAVIVASQATTTGDNASYAAAQAIATANQAQTAGDNATRVANNASQAASGAVLAGSTAAVNADKAVKVANEAKSAGDNATSVANNATSVANSARLVADSTYAYANSEISIQSTATAKAQSAADNAFSQAQAVGSQASADISSNSTATAKAQSTADNAFSQATVAIDNNQVTSQAVTDLKDGSKLTIADLENGLATKVANSDYASYKVQTASQIAQKVDNGAFSAYQTTTADLIAQKVATKDFSAYQATTAKSIDSKVSSNDFNTYKTQTADLIDDKVSSSEYASDKTQTASEIADRVSNSAFSTYQTQTASQIAQKVDNGTFSAYQTTTAGLIAQKVATSDFSAYQATTAKEISSKVESSDFQTYQTQTKDMIASKVSKSDANNANLIPYSSNFTTPLTGWTLMNWGATDRKLLVTTHTFYQNGTGALLYLNTAQNGTAAAGSNRFPLSPNTTYTFQFKAFASSNVVGANVYLLTRTYGSTNDYDIVHGLFTNLVTSPSHIDQYTVTFTTGANDNEGYIRVDNIGSNNSASSGLFFTELKLELGGVATPYVYGGQDSMISQMSDDINLRVTKDGLIDQINLQAGKTLISSSGQLTLSGKSVLLDSVDPVVMKSANIANLAVGTAQIANGAITNAQIGSLAVDTANIKDAAISSAKIANLAVGTAQIGDGAITNAKIGKLAVGTAQIANGAITNAQIGSLAVDTANIKDAAISSAKIANLAVGTAQIGDGAITNAKIGKLAVGTAQIANAAITDAQVGNVSANKLTAGTIDFNTITGKNINASNITTGKLNTDRLNVNKLSALSANLGDITTGTLKGVNIVAKTFSTPNGSFTTDENGVITAKKMTLSDGTVSSTTINASTINGTTINAGSISTNANNTAKFYPFTADSDGVLRSYSVNDYFANYARMYSGNIVISDRNMVSTGGNKYGGETAVIGGSSISLSAGYTVGKDTDFSKPLVAEGESGTTQLVLSGINGITLKGDDQKIHFHGMYSDRQPKGITFTPYGNINGDEGSTTGNWYVGYNLANMTAQFGIDNLSKNTIELYRPTFVDEIGAMGNRLSMGRLLLHAVDGNAQMYLLNDGKPAFVSPTIYNRTYSNGANMFVTSSGRVGRSTSASKYKLAIARSDDTVQADRLMTLKPASWNDKVATEKMAESLSNGEIPVEEEINLKRHYGLIAEDLRDAGLDEFLITGKDGQIEGIEYDRLWTVLIPKIKQLNNRINELERKTL
ncbi:beta strand repeat-containing protein [Lactiplantibacillus plantarum]|uniref:beta strand repeat-containing protein n=1 Tax=Lactiplantibacillus plantarum TaxID=1590 RepID=UPI00034E22C8|nr:tail fiber [Lactiplantibacillus plantarum]EPD25912.1 tail fiber [Lactiplantibacillus plantarum IPLA88]